MKRPLCVIGLTLLIATRVSFCFAPKEGLLLATAVVATALLLFVVGKGHRKTGAVVLLVTAVGLLFGAQYQQSRLLPFAQRQGEIVRLEGDVVEAKQTGGQSYRYRVAATFPQEGLPDGMIVLRDYQGLELRVGERIVADVELRSPRYETTQRYYEQEGIPTEGLLVELLEVGAAERSPRLWLGELRQGILEKNQRNYPPETAAMVNGVVFGMTGEISPQLYRSFNRSGISHILSVSGMHLSLLIGVVLAVLERLGVRKRPRLLLAGVFALGFTCLVGLSSPLVRACVMMMVFLAAQLMMEEGDPLSALGFSGIVIVGLWPYWVLSLGLWLSFGATFGILVLSGPLTRRMKKRYLRWRDGAALRRLTKGVIAGLAVALSAYLFTLPILVAVNGQIGILAPLANLLVSPFATVILVGGILATLLPVGFPGYPVLLWLVEGSSRMVVRIAQLLGELPFGVLGVDHWPMVVAVVLVVGLWVGTAVLVTKKKKRVVLGAVLLSVLLLAVGKTVTVLDLAGKVELVVFDQMEPVLLLRGRSGVLVGAPSPYEVEQLLGYLEYRGVRRLDALVLLESEGKVDGGLRRLTQGVEVATIMAPDDAFVLEQLALQLPGTVVYSTGYSNAELLGGVRGTFDPGGEKIGLEIGREKVLISGGKYDIMEKDWDRDFGGPRVTLSLEAQSAWFPPRSGLYGERRVLIKL